VPFGIGPLELVIILLIVLLIFGARRLPEMGRSLGSGMREFKKGISGEKEREEQEAKASAEAIQAPRADETRPVS
jgi:sec-independent protein translocase protein TatA